MRKILVLTIVALPLSAFAQSYTPGGVAYGNSSGSALITTVVPPSGDLLVGNGSGPVWESSLSTLEIDGPMGLDTPPESNIGLLVFSYLSGGNTFGIDCLPNFTYTGNSQTNISTRSQAASLVTGSYTGLGYYNVHLETPYSITGSKNGFSAQLYIDQGAGFISSSLPNSWGIYQAGTRCLII